MCFFVIAWCGGGLMVCGGGLMMCCVVRWWVDGVLCGAVVG